MKKDSAMPEGYTCECGFEHRFPPYVYAHWREVLVHTCEMCGAEYTIICGTAKRKRKGKKVDNAD